MEEGIKSPSTSTNNSLRNFNEKIKENSDKNSDRDTEYLTAVNYNDIETAQRLVDEAARKAGYNSLLLYHGTNSFGFTEFDLDKMDDKRSIFLTSDEEIASTYSGVTGARSVSDIYKKDMSKMSAADLVKELNAYEQKYKNNTADEFHKYELYNFEKLNKLISKVNDGMSLDSQWREWAELYPGYFDKDVNASDQPLLFCASI